MFPINFSQEKLDVILLHLNTTLNQIDEKKSDISINEKKKLLFSLIEDRMYKYAFRLAEEHKLRKEDEIKAIFYKIVWDIFDYTVHLVEADWPITQEEINLLHKKLYPKWLWWPTIDQKWNRVLKLYPAGEFRKARDYKKTTSWEYDYLDFHLINEHIEYANIFLHNSEYHPLIKISLYLIFVWEIHPYYNGNGTLYLFVIAILLLQNGYTIPNNLIAYLQHTVDDGILEIGNKWDYEPFIQWFLELFLVKNQ